MLRVSTTTLESYRRVVATPWGDEAELVAQIKGAPFKPTWQMQAGTAWDRILEADGWGPVSPFVRYGDFSFHVDALRRARELIGPGLWQVKATRVWDTPRGPAAVVAKADHVHGLLVDEVKAKFSNADARDYESVLQWRYYLAVLGAQSVRYHLFCFADPKDGYCELEDVLPFRFWRYDELDLECRAWLVEFVEWAAGKGLLGYLERQYADAA